MRAHGPDADASFQEFVRSRWPRLVRMAYLLTGDRHHAEDVVQAALAKTYRSWRRVSRSDHPDAYVRRVVISCHRDRFRKRRPEEYLTDIPPDRPDERDALHRAEQRRVLMAALARLAPKQRAVVVLRYWEDLPEAEVARILGCSTGTVRSQASKALSTLRAVLGEERLLAFQGGNR